MSQPSATSPQPNNGTTKEPFEREDDRPGAMVLAEATHAFEPVSLGQAFRISKLLVASGLLPKSIQTAEAACAIIICGRELGLTMMQSVRSIHVIEGKPSLSADLMVALARRSPACKFFRVVETTNERCTCETWRHGQPEAERLTWTIEDAKNAGLLGKDNWKRYPAAMLRARCKSALARSVYEKELIGIYTPDEVHDMIDEGDQPPEQTSMVTITPVVETPPEDRSARRAQQTADRVNAKAEAARAKAAAPPPSEPKQPTVERDPNTGEIRTPARSCLLRASPAKTDDEHRPGGSIMSEADEIAILRAALKHALRERDEAIALRRNDAPMHVEDICTFCLSREPRPGRDHAISGNEPDRVLCSASGELANHPRLRRPEAQDTAGLRQTIWTVMFDWATNPIAPAGGDLRASHCDEMASVVGKYLRRRERVTTSGKDSGEP